MTISMTMFCTCEDEGSVEEDEVGSRVAGPVLGPGTKARFANGSVLGYWSVVRSVSGYCFVVRSAIGYCTAGSLVPSVLGDEFSGSVDISDVFFTSVVMSPLKGAFFRSVGRCRSTDVDSGTSRVWSRLPG